MDEEDDEDDPHWMTLNYVLHTLKKCPSAHFPSCKATCELIGRMLGYVHRLLRPCDTTMNEGMRSSTGVADVLLRNTPVALNGRGLLYYKDSIVTFACAHGTFTVPTWTQFVRLATGNAFWLIDQETGEHVLFTSDMLPYYLHASVEIRNVLAMFDLFEVSVASNKCTETTAMLDWNSLTIRLPDVQCEVHWTDWHIFAAAACQMPMRMSIPLRSTVRQDSGSGALI